MKKNNPKNNPKSNGNKQSSDKISNHNSNHLEYKINELIEEFHFKEDTESIEKELKNKIILITGASGSIGSYLTNEILDNYSYKTLILVDRAENSLYELQQKHLNNKKGKNCFYLVSDIKDSVAMEDIFKEYHPDIVFHAAAYKQVPLMEDSAAEAIKNNIFGSKIIADLSSKYHIKKFIFVSTDKAVNPTSVMGATKRVVEMYLQEKNRINKKNKKDIKNSTHFFIIRFGNVLGSNGSVFHVFTEQIRNNREIMVTSSEISRYFMTIQNSAKLLLQVPALGKDCGTFILQLGNPVKIIDLAKKIISFYGYKYPEEINIKFAELRKGEKIKEELYKDSDLLHDTDHLQIKYIEETENNIIFDQYFILLSKIFIDNSLNLKQRNNKLMKILRQIVPEYKLL